MKRKKRVARRVKPPRKAPKKIAGIEARGVRTRPKYLPDELAGLYRPVKKPVTLRLDADVLSWFQRDGRGYQTRINSALRKVMLKERG